MVRRRHPGAWFGVVAGVVLAGGLLSAQAQVVVTKNPPRPAESIPSVVSIVPPGATLGQTTEWTITGRNLAGVERLRIAGEGIAVTTITIKSNESITALVQVSHDAAPGFREVHAESPDGLANLMVVRIDALRQTAESEPNDDPTQANELPRGSAAVGVLKPQDLDHFLIIGKAGERLTIEVEAQRLGTAVVPVVTVLTPRGSALAQGRRVRGDEHDCRLSYTLPSDGTYVVQVRDNLYGGGESAVYRLRVVNEPIATGLFPLGGPRGQSVTVTASGGNLDAPRSKTLTLPDQPGAIVDVGSIDGPGGPTIAPARLIVGDGPEVFEADDDHGPSTTRLVPLDRREGKRSSLTVNGRIDRPGEVDRYILPVKKGDSFRVKVHATSLGSWLDSVVAIRDKEGNLLAENDDPGGNANNTGGGLFGVAQVSPDSLLEYEAQADGELFMEITDRYGDGGPEYAYRMVIGAPQPDFEIKLLLSNPNAGREFLVNPASKRRVAAGGPAATGALNLKPGAVIPLNFLVAPVGRPGPIVVKAEGLPQGVTAEPVTIRLPAPLSGGRRNVARDSPPASNSLVLRVAANAAPAVGELRVVATAKLEDGTILTREATGALVIDLLSGNAQTSPPVRLVSHIPVKIVGTPRAAEPVRTDEAVTLKQIVVPGVLLQGGWLDLSLELEPADVRADRFKVRGETTEKGLAVADAGAASEAAETGVALRVTAVNAEPGVKTVTIRFEPTRGDKIERTVAVIVRPPIQLNARPDLIALDPGGSANLWVGVVREPGYQGPVELRVVGLPDGVKAPGRTVVPADQDGGMIRLVRDQKSRAGSAPTAVRVVGVARMPKGPVTVDSAIRPMVGGSPADK